MIKTRVMLVVPQLYTGGVQKLAIDLASKIDRSQVELRLLSLAPRSGQIFEEKADELGLDVTYLSKRKGVDLSVIPQIFRAIREFKPDVLHANQRTVTYLLLPMLLCRVKRRFYAVHSLADRDAHGIDRWMLKLANRFFGLKLIAISDFCKQSIVDVYHVNPSSVSCVYNGVDLDSFARCAPYEQMREDEIRFISIGSFLPLKNKALMLDAFKLVHDKYPHTRLVLLGDGVQRKEIEAQAVSLGIDQVVTFLGNVGNVAEELEKAHIYLMSSDYEGLPVVLLEAMAAGLPIITTKAGGSVDVVKDGVNGILTEVGDCAAFAQAMERLTQDRALRLRYANGSLSESKKYSLEKMAENYLELYLGKR